MAVCVRVRPPTAAETQAGICVSQGEDENCIVVKHKEQDPKEMRFDKILWQNATQRVVCRVVQWGGHASRQTELTDLAGSVCGAGGAGLRQHR